VTETQAAEILLLLNDIGKTVSIIAIGLVGHLLVTIFKD